jgi:hypothetical protein
MPVLSYQQIDQGIDSIVATRKSPITGLGDEAWAYLLKFTAYFEGAVNFMYSNKDLPNVSGPDVTVGVGISIPNRGSVQGEFNRTMFYVKGTNYTQPATLPQVQADYDTVAGMSRLTNKLDDYYAAVKTEIRPADALGKLPDRIGNLVPSRLNHPDFKDFANWPAQARVALASYCYGISPQGAPSMRTALRTRDFDTAGRQSYIPGWSLNKVLAHRKLFWNAARLVDASVGNSVVDTDRLQDRFDSGIDILPAPAWPARNPPPRPPDTTPP